MIEAPIEPVEGELVDPEDVPLGETIWVTRASTFSFDARKFSEETLVLANGIDTSEFVSGQVTALLHAKNKWALGTGLNIVAQAVELDPLDPSVEFLGPTIETGFADSDAAPGIVTLSIVLPAKLRLSLRWTQKEEEAADVQSATISVLVTVRRHLPPTYLVRA